VGLAVSDPEGGIALGLETFEARHGSNLVDHLRELLRTYEVVRLVIGLPLRLDGGEGEAAKRSRALARRLRKDLGIPVDLWDERLTSTQGDRVLRGTGAPKGARDRLAATLILQSYLDRRREGSR
jgi:putative Holliday junction resolvase